MVKPGKQAKKKTVEPEVHDALVGMKAICEYYMRSEPTILGLIRDSGFPARKIGGIWEASKSRVDSWRDAYFHDERAAG